ITMPRFKSLSDIRRSLKGDIPPPPPSRLNAGVPSATIPPKKVIKALYDFTAESPNELSFRAGDFFHVIGNENDVNWYEAYNPLTNARGMVPVKYFEVLGRQATSPASATPPALPPISSSVARFSSVDEITNIGGNKPMTSPLPRAISRTSTGMGGAAHTLHGVMLFDFAAERPNELNASAGDDILIVAQSHEDWFVAKFINKLGGPGLIPVAFVEVHDPETNSPVDDLAGMMQRLQISLPSVEEWKRMVMQQEQDSESSDVLGAMGGGRHQRGPSNVSHHSHHSHHSHTSNASGMARSNSRGTGFPASEVVDSACVESYITQEDQFWFLIRLFMADGSQHTVYRVYEDFYSFQIALLDTFPEEAGRTGKRRILPYMPAPLSFVDEVVTAERCGHLDTYIKELCDVPEYIRNSTLLRRFFGLEEDEDEDGDVVSNGDGGNGGGQHRHTHSTSSSAGRSQRRGTPPNSGRAAGKVNSSSYGSPTSPLPETAAPAEAGNVPMLKVKLMYNDDLIAIRVPNTITYVALWEKIFERLGPSVKAVSWKGASGDWNTLDSEDDLRQALSETGGKLTLHAT
ncbi:hypothetical protein THASP1DRAFT_12258, partial [Thamnocephalis sphaerospora]